MSRYIVSPEAVEDLFEIWRYIAEDSIEAANRVESELFGTFEALAKTPGQGHRRTDLISDAVLFFPVYSYLVVYRPKRARSKLLPSSTEREMCSVFSRTAPSASVDDLTASRSGAARFWPSPAAPG